MDRRPLGVHETRAAPPRPRLFCLPSSDGFFATLVEKVAGSLALQTPRELEDALRPRYPGISIHLRGLAGEPVPTWYVYWERTFPAHPGEVGG
jgi:hypothetical protein